MILTFRLVKDLYMFCNTDVFENNSYNNNTRKRRPQTPMGRWTQREPLGYVDGANLYQYVASQPTVSIDSHGLAKKKTMFSAPILDYEAKLARQHPNTNGVAWDEMLAAAERLATDPNICSVNEVFAKEGNRNTDRKALLDAIAAKSQSGVGPECRIVLFLGHSLHRPIDEKIPGFQSVYTQSTVKPFLVPSGPMSYEWQLPPTLGFATCFAGLEARLAGQRTSQRCLPLSTRRR